MLCQHAHHPGKNIIFVTKIKGKCLLGLTFKNLRVKVMRSKSIYLKYLLHVTAVKNKFKKKHFLKNGLV
jgi:hypothetical protein